MRMKQIWRCQKCGHEFYTPLEKKQSWWRKTFLRSEAIGCEKCKSIAALRKRVVKFKEKKDEEKMDVNPFTDSNFANQHGIKGVG